jgi:hypothetical protein
VISAEARNEGKIPVEFTQAYIANATTGGAYAFGVVTDNSDIEAPKPFPKFPHILQPRRTVEIPASGDTLSKMLPMLRIGPDDSFVFRLIDNYGTKYETNALRAGDYMQKKRLRVEIKPRDQQ